jgi:hypothetical protein
LLERKETRRGDEETRREERQERGCGVGIG